MDAQQRRDLIDALTAVEGVRLVYLFGSVADGTEGPLSDLDLAVWFDATVSPEARFRRRMQAAAAAARVLGRDDVDLVALNDAPPLLCHEVLSGGRCLWVADRADEVALRVRTLRGVVAARRLLAVARPYLMRDLREGARGLQGDPPDSAR